MDAAEMIREAFSNEHALEGAALAAMPGPAVKTREFCGCMNGPNYPDPMCKHCGGGGLTTIGDEWSSKVVSFFVTHGMLDDRDEYDIGDVMAALVDNYEPSSAEPAPDLASENERLRAALKKTMSALTPLSDAVFNDNGDMTVSVPRLSYEQCVAAYFAAKAANVALERKP